MKFVLILLLVLLAGCNTNKKTRYINNLMEAQRDIALHQYQTARNKLEVLYKKVSLKNKKGEILYWIGFSYIYQKRYYQSQKCLKTADKLYSSGPVKGLIKARLIAVYLAQDNATSAIQCYNEMVVGQYPELAETEYNLGNYYTKKGQLKKASLYYQKCFKRNDAYFSSKAKPLIVKIGDGDFHLQVGLYSKLENAKKIANQLKRKYNQTPTVVKIYRNGRALYRIQTGHFSSRAAAEKKKLQLKYRYPDLELLVKP